MFINEFFGKKKVETVAEGEDNCPPATQDIALNLENRKKAIDEYGYGPLNPALPNTKFWMHKVNEWNLDSADEAKQSLCGNCAAFDIRQNTLGCIAQGIDSSNPEDAASVIDAGDLGYCKFLKFKCASQRTCDAWVTGGPLTDEQGVAEAGPFSYGAKKPRKGSVADLAAKKRKEQEQGQQPIEPKDQQVGVARVTKGVAEGSLNESDKFTSWYDWKDQAKSSGYTITKKDDKIVALNKQGQVVGHWSDVGKFLSGKAPRPNFKRPVEQGVAEGLGKDIKRLATGKDVKSRAGQEIAKSQDASMKGDTKTSKKHFDRYDKLDKLANKEQGVAEGAVEDLAKDLKNPHSYNAIDHMMQSIADKSNVTPKELHNQFVEKYGMTPDEWIKNEQGVEETYGAKLHTEHKRNRFKQLEKIKQQQEKALGLGEAGCNMTNEGRYCSEHGMMECPGYGMTETSVQDKLHQQHQELRKQRGLPDPSYYKKLAAQKQAEIDALRAEIAADRAKSMKESLRPGERHHYEDDPKTGKRVYKGIRGDQYDAPKKTTGHEHDADRDRAAHRAHDRSMTESIESYMEELDRAGYGLQEEKVRLDPKCWKGKKIGSPKTKVKGGVRVNNCVPK